MKTKPKLFIEKIFVDRKLESDKLVRQIVNRLPGTPVVAVDDRKEVENEISLRPDPVGEGKKIIYLTENKSFLRPCPCTPGCLSCGYWNIDLDQNCPLDCSYCILQAYLKGKPLTLSVNRSDLAREVKNFLKARRSRTIRIGTGELTDSLALDWLTENSLFLVEIFKEKRECLLEFKTKTGEIDNLLSIKPPSNVIISWSLNPEVIISQEEKGTASLATRLEAAERAVKHGYRVGFHFDPIIYYDSWKEDYSLVIDEVFQKIPLEAILWISLGTLRFPPDLPDVASRRFRKSRLYGQELVRGWDGKFRYPRPRRVKIYDQLIEIFQDYKAADRLYLCMESRPVYEFTLLKKIRGRPSSTFPFFWLR